MNDTMDKALDSGVTPDQFRAAYEKRQCTAISTHGHSTIRHTLATNAVYVVIVRKEFLNAEIPLHPADAIRWGESLAAAGREAQK